MSLVSENTNNGDKFYRRKFIWATNEKLIINKLGPKTLTLVPIQLLIAACSFCFGNSKQHNNGYMTTCPDLGLQPNSFPSSTNRLAINQVRRH